MIIAGDRRERPFVDRFVTLPLNVRLVQRSERANVQFRARQPRNRRFKIEACRAHRQRRGAHQFLQLVDQPGRRAIACADIRDERQRAVGARPCHRGHIAHECVSAKHGFDAVEIDARPAYLDLPVLTADTLQQPVGPLAREVSGTKHPASVFAIRLNAFVRKTSPDPTSQRHVWACDDELADFARRRGTTLCVDQRETVAR